MADQKGIREQAEALLEMSNSILAFALGECWEEMDELIRRRADLLESVYGAGKMSKANRDFLAGVMEHVRIVDSATRQFLDRERNNGWPEPGDVKEVLKYDPRFLIARVLELEPSEFRRHSAF